MDHTVTQLFSAKKIKTKKPHQEVRPRNEHAEHIHAQFFRVFLPLKNGVYNFDFRAYK